MVDSTARISEEMKRELADIIRNELKDPRLPEMVNIVSVDVTRDLRMAKVFVSMLGGADEKKEALKGLRSAAGFIRREIGQRVQLRYTPEIHFEMDDSIEKGVHISQLINDTMKKDNQH